jgi:hypothetical protein
MIIQECILFINYNNSFAIELMETDNFRFEMI